MPPAGTVANIGATGDFSTTRYPFQSHGPFCGRVQARPLELSPKQALPNTAPRGSLSQSGDRSVSHKVHLIGDVLANLSPTDLHRGIPRPPLTITPLQYLPGPLLPGEGALLV